jgi:hypothetical protein
MCREGRRSARTFNLLIDLIARIGWFGVLKGYIPHQWNISQEAFYREHHLDAKYDNGEQWTS